MKVYKAYFKLITPVNNFIKAHQYLLHDSMKDYIENKTLKRKILLLEWYLIDEQYGYIMLYTKKELKQNELLEISDYVSGQNSDGLGEGFEGQNFGASFDWQTNKYLFTEVTLDAIFS